MREQPLNDDELLNKYTNVFLILGFTDLQELFSVALSKCSQSTIGIKKKKSKTFY